MKPAASPARPRELQPIGMRDQRAGGARARSPCRRALPGKLSDSTEQRAVQGLAFEFVTQLGVIGTRDSVVSRPHSGTGAAFPRRIP